ncbi:MAG: elongation factor 4 [Candidatus Sericytochromatia bacterium]|nr:MAG: elongation factor 4 [Candidatus Sericytochromatia bacterium]
MINPERIRNFSIIAHIDHGKSTLADRLIEYTGALSEREMTEQVLDSMEIEKERGITIKAQTARLNYKAKDGLDYVLNLIDTPGHVDFNYEVSRSLAACEGALLIVDATQGVEAQTIANAYLAIDNYLEIIPVINKIDLPSADPERVKKEIEDILGIDSSDAVLASAKEGIGIEEILEAIVKKIPSPKGDKNKPLRALIYDSFYDSYRGVVILFRIFDGQIKLKDKIRMMSTGKIYEVDELGFLTPKQVKTDSLGVGETGYLTASIKDIQFAKVGDTITLEENPAEEPLPGYKPATPMVFCGLYPIDTDQYEELKEALEKLRLNDAALSYEPETSGALGFGFRCGFLGLLHMEIVKERLEREYNLSIILTPPSVVYTVYLTDKSIIKVDNPMKLPPPVKIDKIEEPYVKVSIILPNEYVGTIMELAQNRRGIFCDMQYLDTKRVNLIYEMPLGELITDFFDQLKSRSKGYASLDYELTSNKEADLVKLDILVSGDRIDALSMIVPRQNAYKIGKQMTEKLKEIIPRQMFDVRIQAAIGGKIIASENISAMRKNVLAKCYGGDVSRKRKLLEKQKEGKKRMKQIGNVEIPQEAFMAVLKIGETEQ